ncbi:MAG TPA: hypothetical protein VG294_04480 [Solirubrobacteraceae bacterium]|nr:hypothetical protein [Solirubrobacteraceae bacterium]
MAVRGRSNPGTPAVADTHHINGGNMQRRIPRSALVAWVVGLTAASAGSAQAAITAVTGPAVAVTANSAISPARSETAGGQIVAGPTARFPLADLASNLMPSTTYTFKLIADDDTLGAASTLLAPVYGGLLTLTTKGPGSASLASTKLMVRKGRVIVPLRCSNALACSGGTLAIAAHHKGTKVACASATFSVGAGTTRTVSTGKVSAKCKALLVAAKKHTISARLTAGFTYQKALSENVSVTTVK